MLVIRSDQMKILEAAMVRNFEGRVMRHLRRSFAPYVGSMGTEELAALIRHGVNKADAYGIARELDVVTFVEFMVRYGRAFYSDPNLPWAVQVLQDQTLGGPEKISKLKELEG